MKTKNTRRAFFMSIVSLLLCFTMMLGTTLAWFTDSVTVSGNRIVAGNLDVELYYKNGTMTDFDNVANAAANKMFVDKNGNDILWEPGVVAYTNFEIRNVGNLALKYALNTVITDETRTVVDGVTYSLKDVIKVAVLLDETVNNREEAIAKAVAEGKTIADIATDGKLLPEGDTDACAVVLYWAPNADEVDNKYNLNNDRQGDDALDIIFDIRLVATQLTHENDSFDDQYDKDAAFSVWNGVIPTEMPETLVVDTDNKVISINDAAAFSYLNTLINSDDFYANYGSKWMYSIELNADIDLASKEWTPINMSNFVAFEGNGHTIKNLYVNTTEENGGLFSNISCNDIGVTYVRNFTVDGASVRSAKRAGVIAASSPQGSIDNVTVNNAIVVGTKYVGGIFGGGNGSVTNSTVKNSIISIPDTAADNKDEKEAGGLVGYMANDGPETAENKLVNGNTVENVTISAPSVASALVSQPNSANTGEGVIAIEFNTVKNVTVTTADDTADIFVSNNVGDKSNVSNNTEINCTVNKSGTPTNVAFVGEGDDLADAIKNNDMIVLDEGEYTLPTLSGKDGITLIGAADGSTVIGGDNASTGFASNFGKNTAIQNVTFTGSSNGVRWSYAQGGTSTFDNCTFAGDSTYGFHIDSSNGATFIFNDCTFSGFNAFAGDLKEVIFNNCTFLNNGNYGHTNIWSVGKFNDCTFGDNVSIGQGKDSGAKLYFNGVEESYHHEYIASAESLFAFAESVNVGGDSWKNQKVSLVADIDLENKTWTPIGQTGATEFKGIFDGQNYTIKNLNVDNSAATDEYTSSGLFGWAESNVTIKNVKIDGATVKGNHNVAAIVGYTYSGKISNCNVTNANIVCTHANNDACGDKCGLIAGYAADESRISNCSASDSTVVAGRDGGQLIGAGYNVSVSGCSATNVTVTAGGDCNGNNINEAIIGRILG